MSLTKKEIAEVREYLNRRKNSCQTGNNVGRICDNGIKIVDEYDKYGWHDILKNPDDLPEKTCDVLICVRRWSTVADDWIDDDYKVTTFWCKGNKNVAECFEYGRGWIDRIHRPTIKAWREIEPFKGGE